MDEMFEAWSFDASPLLSHDVSLFSEIQVHKDAVWEELMMPCALDDLVIESLQLICKSFHLLSKKMLYDHLKGGYSVTEQTRVETTSVTSTNT